MGSKPSCCDKISDHNKYEVEENKNFINNEKLHNPLEMSPKITRKKTTMIKSKRHLKKLQTLNLNIKLYEDLNLDLEEDQEISSDDASPK